MGVVLQKYANVSSIKRLIYAMLIGTILKNELPLEEVTHMQPQTLSLIIAVCSMLIALHMVRKERKSKDAFDAEE
jgi:uncharacterized membrane protein YfcA